LHAISKKNALFRIYVTLWTLFLVMMRFLSMAMAVMEKEDMKTPRLGRVFTSLKKRESGV
jgi:hypothetical protein